MTSLPPTGDATGPFLTCHRRVKALVGGSTVLPHAIPLRLLQPTMPATGGPAVPLPVPLLPPLLLLLRQIKVDPPSSDGAPVLEVRKHHPLVLPIPKKVGRWVASSSPARLPRAILPGVGSGVYVVVPTWAPQETNQALQRTPIGGGLELSQEIVLLVRHFELVCPRSRKATLIKFHCIVSNQLDTTDASIDSTKARTAPSFQCWLNCSFSFILPQPC